MNEYSCQKPIKNAVLEINLRSRKRPPSCLSQSIEKQMVWKSIAYTFCLLEYWSHSQSESINISHSKTQFLGKSSLNM